MMRILLICLAMIFNAGVSAQTITMGDKTVEAAFDNGNGNLLLAQQAILAQPATLQSLSFYVTTASGSLVLGIYSPNGANGGPGTLVATTTTFTAITGWNTQATTTHPVLQSGTYWLAYFPSSSNLAFRKQNNSGSCWMKGRTFGALPTTFPTSPVSCTPTTWSFYASLTGSGVVAPPVATAAPVVTGNLLIGSQLSTTNGTWSNSPTSYAYQWLDNGTAISGATTSKYTTQTADVGKMVSAKVTATNAGGAGISTSATVGPITAPVAAPVNVALPSVTIAPAAGSVLSATTGTWTNEITSYAYQWLTNGSPIPAATSVNYTTKSADVGKVISAKVTATGPGGNTTIAAGPMLGWATGKTSASTPFTALHTYFMAPTGNDACNGSSAAIGSSGNCAWATPNHALVCGDVIIAATGNYTDGFQTWGVVSNCPSTTGGIDGAGGIYFATLLCSGNVGTCTTSNNNGASTQTYNMDINTNNWAIEGWSSQAGYVNGSSGFGYTINTGNSRVAVAHHIAFINNISYHNAGGFTVNSEGANSGVGNGVDYWAIVGSIAQDSAGRNDGFWDGAIDVIGIKDLNTTAGTHIFVDGNFSYNNQQTTGGASDGECYLFDTLDLPNPGFSQQIVFRDNIGFLCERFTLQFFNQQFNANTPPMKVYNNTLFAGNKCAFGTGCTGGVFGEYNFQGGNGAGGGFSWAVSLYNNIGKAVIKSGQGNWAMMQGYRGNPTNVTVGNTGSNPANSENIFIVPNSSCDGDFCDTTFNVTGYDTLAQLGVNTYVDPAFSNTTDLLANQIGTPNCTSFTNVTACMGWNANTNTLTTLSAIGDLTAGCAQCTGKGYRRPSTTCVVSDADYPTWLKGIVYLHWTGTAIEQRHDLVTTPCGL